MLLYMLFRRISFTMTSNYVPALSASSIINNTNNRMPGTGNAHARKHVIAVS